MCEMGRAWNLIINSTNQQEFWSGWAKKKRKMMKKKYVQFVDSVTGRYYLIILHNRGGVIPVYMNRQVSLVIPEHFFVCPQKRGV